MWVKWDSEIHPEEELYVCTFCDAHMHCDSMGEVCPNCGTESEDEED